MTSSPQQQGTSANMNTQKLPFEFRTWQQLTKSEKLNVIKQVNAQQNDICSNLLNCFNDIVDANITADGEDIEECLLSDFGITANVSFSFFQQGSGFCFDSEDVDEFVLFRKFNYKGLFDNTDEAYLLHLRNYITQITVQTLRVNFHYDHENSVRFSVRNHNENAADLLEACDYDLPEGQASYATTTEFQLFQQFEAAFVENEIEDFLNEWMHDFCVEKHAQLERSFFLKEEEVLDIFDEIFDNIYGPIKSDEDLPRFIFVNEEENIDIVCLVD